MIRKLLIRCATWLLTPLALIALPVAANIPASDSGDGLQCVPYAREVSGIQIYGDAHSWWRQAEHKYRRGARPAIGSVMTFRPHGVMQLGHVATVRRIVDSRTVYVDHANWSRINGRRGQIERGVMVKDVSADNDWSKVRVWYTPIAALGTTEYPLYGFIYPQRVDDGAASDGDDGNDSSVTRMADARRKPAAGGPRLAYASNVLTLVPRGHGYAGPERSVEASANGTPGRPTHRLGELQLAIANLR